MKKLIVIAILLATSVTAQAAEKAFSKRDTNGDNLISQSEYLAASKKAKTPEGKEKKAKKFARLDINGDGQLSEEEFAARKKKSKKTS